MIWQARIVLRKELVDHVRDRRSLSSALLMPLFGPAMFAVMFTLIASWNREDAVLTVPIAGAQNAPNLVAFLERHGARVETAPPDYEQKIRDGDLDLAISVPDDYGKDFVGGRPAALQLVIDGSRNKARAPIRRVEQLLSQYSSQLGSLRLLARGISPSLAAPLAVSEVDLATPEKTAATLLGVVPIFLLLACFVGGMHLAIDCTAGERERGSLEPLLVNPVSRPALLAGKWAATVLVALLALLVTLVAFGVALSRVPLQDLGVKVTLSAREGLRLFVLGVPLAICAAAFELSLALFARTFKEAQTYLSILLVIPMLPATFLALSPLRERLALMCIPVLSQALLFGDVLRGESVRASYIAASAGSTILAGYAFFALAVRMLGNERIVFGRSG
ncbi:MAG: ABC transporter permease [Myxococcales bacterium]